MFDGLLYAMFPDLEQIFREDIAESNGCGPVDTGSDIGDTVVDHTFINIDRVRKQGRPGRLTDTTLIN